MSEDKPSVSWKYPKVHEGYKVKSVKPELCTPLFSFLVIEVNGELFEGYFCNKCRKNARVNEQQARVFCYYCTYPNSTDPLQDEIPKGAGTFHET